MENEGRWQAELARRDARERELEAMVRPLSRHALAALCHICMCCSSPLA